MKVLVAICMKERRLGFSKIGRDLRIDLRELRYGARKVEYFRHFETKSGNRITDQPCTLAIYPTTYVFIWTRIMS